LTSQRACAKPRPDDHLICDATLPCRTELGRRQVGGIAFGPSGGPRVRGLQMGLPPVRHGRALRPSLGGSVLRGLSASDCSHIGEPASSTEVPHRCAEHLGGLLVRWAKPRAFTFALFTIAALDASLSGVAAQEPAPASRTLGVALAASDDASENDDSASLSAPAEPGVPLQYQLESVRIEGNRRARSALILPFVPMRPGSSFDVGDPELDAFRYRLLGTGWFDRVEIRLERGRRPGWVVLVVFVEERETLMFQQLALGAGWSVDHATGNANSDVQQPIAEPYLGMAVADTNFLGTGKTVGTELLLARDQQGIALSYADPVIRTAHWGLSTRGTFVNGQEYFGGDHEVLASTSCVRDEDSTQIVEQCTKRWGAVVDYWRLGLNVGGARDIGAYTRLVVGWAGDFVQVPSWGLPQAASEVRGRTEDAQSRRPIDFAIHRGSSLVSMLRFGLVFDKRDSAILPTSGSLVSLQGTLSSRLFGSDYSFVRTEANLHHWFPTGWGHTVRLGAFFGTVFGDAPFFYKFFVSDLTDLLPSRILGLNLDHRPAPNLFGAMAHPGNREEHGTAIAQMRQEELAGRIDAEYVWPLARGRRKFLKNADAYGLIGIYALADPRDLKVSVPGYEGVARVPVDLTFDLGVRMDTQIGVFQIGLAKLLWLPVR